MSNYRFWLYIAFFFILVGFSGFVWQVLNIQGSRLRGRRRSEGGRRSSDKKKLSRNDRRICAQGRKLIAEGNLTQGAQLLESIGLTREAIDVLEKNNKIHEAAKILLRMQRPGRAGVIYARHAMWADAAQCFRLAHMHLEVATSAREAGNFAMAAEYFEKVQKFEPAAECYLECKNYHRAAKAFVSAGNRERAMEVYEKLCLDSEQLAKVEFRDSEIRMIKEFLEDGHASTALADILAARNHLADVVKSLIKKGKSREAGDLYVRSTSDIGPQLMADVNYADQSANNLAQMFLDIAKFSYAGMVLEQMGVFDRAADAFEKAEDFERAVYCLERAGGQKDRVKALRLKLQQTPKPPTAKPKANAFALGEDNSKTSEQEEPTQLNPAPGMTGFQTPPETAAAPDRHIEKRVIEAPPPPSPPSPPPAVPETPKAIFSLSAAEDSHRFENPSIQKPAPHAEQLFTEIPTELIKADEARSAFHRSMFLEVLDFEQRNKLWALGEVVKFANDDVILDFDDEPTGLYTVLVGSVRCFRRNADSVYEIDEIAESSSFGELWLLMEMPTSVRFVAGRDCRLHIIKREDFNGLLDRDGAIARKIYKGFTKILLQKLITPRNKSEIDQAS